MDIKPVMIFGAKDLGKAALEIFKSQNIVIYCFLDDDKELHGSEIGDVSVMGKTKDDGFLKYIGKKCDAFVATEDPKERKALVKMLNDRRKVMPVNAVHQEAYIPESSHLGYGNFLNMGVKVGTDVEIASHCVINTGAIIEHSCELESFVQIGAGAIINADVKIGEGALIGSGAIISAHIKIGKGAQVGPGSLVMQDVPEGAIVFGVPAKEV